MCRSDTVADEKLIPALVRGVRRKTGICCAQASPNAAVGKKNCWLEIVLDEGKNRQIRRMLAALGS